MDSGHKFTKGPHTHILYAKGACNHTVGLMLQPTHPMCCAFLYVVDLAFFKKTIFMFCFCSAQIAQNKLFFCQPYGNNK